LIDAIEGSFQPAFGVADVEDQAQIGRPGFEGPFPIAGYVLGGCTERQEEGKRRQFEAQRT
jgi:hypothetical protein